MSFLNNLLKLEMNNEKPVTHGCDCYTRHHWGTWRLRIDPVFDSKCSKRGRMKEEGFFRNFL